MAAKKASPRGPQLDVAGDLCVAFVNTAAARPANRQLGVGSYADLLTWGQMAAVLSTLEAEHLRQRAAAQPREKEKVFAKAAALRSLLSRLLIAISRAREPPPDDLAALSDALAEALPAVRLAPGEQGVTWGWVGDADALDRMLWPVLPPARGRPRSSPDRPRTLR